MNKEEKNSNKCPICDRPTHKESKYCIFHASAEEKNEKEFKKVLKEYINSIKKENKNYDFRRFIFIGEISFKKDLNVTIFKNAIFSEATFKGSTDFRGATFEEYTSFGGVTFERDVDFMEATFDEYTSFGGVTFERDANFGEAIFKEYTSFGGATFKGDADFGVKAFEKGVTLTEIRVLSGKKLNLKVRNNIEMISLERAYLENAHLDIELDEGILIDFTDALLKNTKIKKSQIENHILQEKKKKFTKAQEIYLLLKNNFHSIGQYKDESWSYTKERDMERMSQSFYLFLNKYKKYSSFEKILMKSNVLKRVIIKTKIFSKWLFSKKAFEWIHLAFSNFIYQYGESPRRVIRFALIIIFLFAFILNFSGIVNSDRTNMIIEFIKKSQGNEYTLRYLGATLGNFLDCLYFSVVTFTTLGYGDFQPAVGASRFFVSVESIVGAFTMALFVYTFARRTGGR